MSRAYPRRTAVGLSSSPSRGDDIEEEGISQWAYFASRAPEPPDWYDRTTPPTDQTEAERVAWEEARWFGWRSYYATKMLEIEP